MGKPKRRRTDLSETTINYRSADFEFVSGDTTGVPFCEHGPTLLLERIKNGEIEQFYACAVCRSRKDCNFYRSYEDECRHPTPARKIQLAKNIMKTNRGFTQKKLYERLKAYRKLSPEKRRFCVECSTLLIGVEEAKKHDINVDGRQHQVINGISNKQLREPSRLMKLNQNTKKESQFLFARDTLAILGENIIEKFEFDGVLCIGTPTLNEFLNKPKYRKICKTFLLDFDYRYAQFWSPRFFAQFSMFNGYFYTKLGEKCYQRFLSQVNKLLIVVDPPFGGLISPLARTLLGIKEKFENGGGACEIALVSPYFMEQKICKALPGMSMLDYKVTYTDTNSLTPVDAGSHVRMFTTLSPELVELPTDGGYRYCDQCKRYVAAENRHCQICNSCTSKDGRPYVHCQKCNKCVKSRYSHCEKCGRCHKPMPDGRECRPIVVQCQLCSGEGHGWVNCPNKDAEGKQTIGKMENTNMKNQKNIVKMEEGVTGKRRKVVKNG